MRRAQTPSLFTNQSGVRSRRKLLDAGREDGITEEGVSLLLAMGGNVGVAQHETIQRMKPDAELPPLPGEHIAHQ